MKSNNKNILDAIIESLEKGNGRVSSAKQAGISFETFCDWNNSQSPRFNSEFSERVKKAEGTGKIKIKEICEQVIMKAATDKDKPAWQAAAWMLERKFKEEYSRMELVENKTVDEFSKYTDEELEDELKKLKQESASFGDKTRKGKKEKENN